MIPAFVGKKTLEHEYLLAVSMIVAIEAGAGGIAHDTGRTGDFVANPVKHASLNPRQRRGGPARIGRVAYNTKRKIIIDIHWG